MIGVDRGAAPLVAAAIIFCTAAGLSIGLALDRTQAPVTPTMPDQNSVDAGFARDMRDHHVQAVTMSTLVRDATKDPEIRVLALDVLLTQQQPGQLYGWLAAWGLQQAGNGTPMQDEPRDDRPRRWSRRRPRGNSCGHSTRDDSHARHG